jgi:hypothetical protein
MANNSLNVRARKPHSMFREAGRSLVVVFHNNEKWKKIEIFQWWWMMERQTSIRASIERDAALV